MSKIDDEANAIAEAVLSAIPEYPMATSRTSGSRYLAYTKIGDIIFRGQSDIGEKHATKNLMDRVLDWKAAHP